MNIRINVNTQSGSSYMLEQKGDKLFIRKGILSGTVIKIYEEIKVGGILHIDFIKDGLYGTPDAHTMFLRSTPITGIDILIR